MKTPASRTVSHKRSDEGQALAAILERLRAHTGRDLGAYRQSTLLRRVARRSRLVHQPSLCDYLGYLQANAQEIEALAADLSVQTTSFFRDPDAWAALQARVIGPLVETATQEAPLRAWVIGCSTGEEAYTLGILLDEEFESRRAQRNYVVFASDVSERFISCASAGCYPPAITRCVSSARLKRYFRLRDGQYQVSNEIRSHMIFAVHDVLRDMPVARLNLVVCRNLMIFLAPDHAAALVGLIRQVCLDQACLFLGSDDPVRENLFRVIDGTHRIFAARPGAKAPHGLLPADHAALAGANSRMWRLRTTGSARNRRAETLAVAEEELQSAAEELEVVSDQLKMKLDELARANSNLESLIAATDAGVIFLDRKLKARRVTSRFAELVGVRAEDLDSSISRYAALLEYDDLKVDTRRVVSDGTPIERRIERRDGRRFAIRIQPYRGAGYEEDDGAVVAVFELTASPHLTPALRESQRRVAAELEVMRVLHRMTIAAAMALDQREALDHILCAAIELHGADMGNIQSLDKVSGTLRIVSHRGFGPAFLARFASVSASDSTSCGGALRRRATVQVSDIPSDSEYAPLREAAAQAGYRAVQSTPLISGGGALLGVLSVHFCARRAFSERDTQLAELLARQAANLMEHRSQHQDLIKLESELRTGRAELAEARRQLVEQADSRN